MTVTNSYRTIMPALIFLLAACGSPERAEPTAVPTVLPTVASTTASTSVAPTPEAPTPEPTTLETATPETANEPTTVSVTEVRVPSFTPATYRDESAGFELDYPADWTLDPSSQVGVRGGQALLLSPGSTPEILAEGGTRISIVTYLWDPKNDLEAYATQRKTAWDASGFVITREEMWQLAGGRSAYIFAIETPEASTFTLLTTVGEDYLQITGEGNLALVEEIAVTLRPTN